MKKNSFIVHDDETGTDYKVEEIPALSVEEVLALRELLPHVKALLELITPTTEDEETTEDEDEVAKETEDEDEVAKETEDDEEEVIDTDEITKDGCGQPAPHKVKDSVKHSVGSLVKPTMIDDSLEINETDEGWKKRYGGRN